MEDNVVIQVILEEGGGIAVQMGNGSDQMSPITLVGILEQVKHSIFQNMHVETINKSSKTYDA